MLEAMELGEFGKDEVLDRLTNLRRLRHEDEMKLNDLLKSGIIWLASRTPR
ncbi:hypothetical protein ACFLUZ_05660 [Chloroflexota bacterium]